MKIGLGLESSLVLVVVWPSPMCVFPNCTERSKKKARRGEDYKLL